MKQEDVRKDLVCWLDGELPPARAAEVRKAVGRDPVLTAEAAELRAVDELLASHPRIEPGPGFEGRVIEGLGRVRAGRYRLLSWGRRHWRSVGAAVAALFVVAFLVQRWGDRSGGDPGGSGAPAIVDYAVYLPPETAPGGPDEEKLRRKVETIEQISEFLES